MKTLVNLSAVLTESQWPDSPRAISALHHELSPGVFVHLGLGPAGLQIFDARGAVAIPLDDLMKLARRHEPVIGTHTPDLGKK